MDFLVFGSGILVCINTDAYGSNCGKPFFNFAERGEEDVKNTHTPKTCPNPSHVQCIHPENLPKPQPCTVHTPRKLAQTPAMYSAHAPKTCPNPSHVKCKQHCDVKTRHKHCHIFLASKIETCNHANQHQTMHAYVVVKPRQNSRPSGAVISFDAPTIDLYLRQLPISWTWHPGRESWFWTWTPGFHYYGKIGRAGQPGTTNVTTYRRKRLYDSTTLV